MKPQDNPISVDSVSIQLDRQLIEQQNREIRTLAWKFKAICKQNGRQGQAIFALRNEVAALREANTFNPGDRARLFAEVRALSVENRRLKEKLATDSPAADVEPYHGQAGNSEES